MRHHLSDVVRFGPVWSESVHYPWSSRMRRLSSQFWSLGMPSTVNSLPPGPGEKHVSSSPVPLVSLSVFLSVESRVCPRLCLSTVYQASSVSELIMTPESQCFGTVAA